MLALPLLLTAAIVVDNGATLRSSPHDAAPRQAALRRGEWLEVRDVSADHLAVYDHARERPGYVRAAAVRVYPVAPSSAPALRAVIDYLSGTPGAEAAGIAHVALYLRALDAGTRPDPAVWDALGTMAERLGRRASVARALPAAARATADDLDVAASYGVTFVRHEHDSSAPILCYEGDAFHRLLAAGGTPEQRLRAAVALTRPECVDDALGPTALQSWNESRAAILDGITDVDAGAAPAWLTARLRLRRAEVRAQLAYALTRRGDPDGAARSSDEAVRQLALVDRGSLLDEDVAWHRETGVRVAAARWAGEPVPAEAERNAAARLAVDIAPGEHPGETCVTVADTRDPRVPPSQRCTFGVVWPASIQRAPQGAALTIAVQPLAGWVELWLFREPPAATVSPPSPSSPSSPRSSPARSPAGSSTSTSAMVQQTLFPGVADPDLGYIEAAGWSPDGARLLVARELRQGSTPGSPVTREFQVLRADTLAVEHHAPSPDALGAFRRWSSPRWRGRTLALR